MIGAHCKLKDRFARRFLTLKGEQVVYSTRQHWLSLVPQLTINLLFALLITAFISISSIVAFPYFLTILLIALVFFALVLQVFIRQLMEWFFHVYIVTNRKIVEVSYKPLLSRTINEVLLDQVRCTEVDVESKGFFYELLSVGTVLLTFDRPTHEETFTIEKIKHPRNVAIYLGDSFEMEQRNVIDQPVWFGGKGKKKYYYRPLGYYRPEANY